VTPTVSIETALNGDKYIRAFCTGSLGTWGNTSKTAISVVISKMGSGIDITCGMTGNYGILSWQSATAAYFTVGVSVLSNLASQAKDRSYVKSTMEYIDDLMKNYFKEENHVQPEKNSDMSVPEKIRQLSLLKEQGILTDDEFKQKKTELLSTM
jgi:hypothetical protein